MCNLEKYLDNINYVEDYINPIRMVITSSSFNNYKELRDGIIVAVIVKDEEMVYEFEDFIDEYNESIDNVGVIFYLTTQDNASEDDEIVKGYTL